MTASAAPALTRTATRATDVREIGEALRSLWRDCCPEDSAGDVSRALTTNIVVVADAADEVEARAALQRVVPRLPCRAFLTLLDAKQTEVSTEVTAVARGRGDRRDIVLEEVVLRLPHGKLQLLPGIVRPLLVNDLPSHLYWRCDWPADAVLAAALVDLCEHLVVDSSRYGPPSAAIERIHGLRAQGQRVTDLTWLRMRPWRRALAEAFERITWRPNQKTRGTIRHKTSAAAEVIVLAHWLEERLAAVLDLDESGSQDPDQVRLLTGDCELRVELEQSQLVVQVTTLAHCYLPFRLPTSRGSEGDLLAAAVDAG